jgi:hypothetical protein
MFIGGCQRDWDRLPDPAAPLIVGIDGAYVHAKDQQSRTEGWFKVIAACRSETTEMTFSGMDISDL